MAKKKKQPAPKPPAAQADDPQLPAPLRALNADYSAVLRMRNVRWLIVILTVVAALWLGAYLSAVFVPVLFALAMAYILNPLVVKLERKGIRRTRAVLLTFLLFIVVAGAVGTWFVASVVRDAQAVSGEVRTVVEDLRTNQSEWIAAWNEAVPIEQLHLDPDDDPFTLAINEGAKQLFPQASEVETPEASAARAQMAGARAELLAAFQRADRNGDLALTPDEIAGDEFKLLDADENGSVSMNEWFVRFGATVPVADARALRPGMGTEGLKSVVGTGLQGLFTLLLFVTLVPIYTWYFLIGYDKFVSRVRDYLPGAHKPRIEGILKEIDAMLRAFFRGRIVVVAIITVATTIVYLAFGVQYAVLLGLMSGLGVLIPYFSMIAGWIPALLLMLIAGDSWAAIIGMSVCFHAIQAIEQYVLTPKLLGNSMELHPVTILVGVFAMASLFGIFGALLAVPLTAIAKTLGREFLLPYFKSLAKEKPRARDAPAANT